MKDTSSKAIMVRLPQALWLRLQRHKVIGETRTAGEAIRCLIAEACSDIPDSKDSTCSPAEPK